MQLRGEVDSARISRWVALLEARRQLDSATVGLAERWLDAARVGDPEEEREVSWAAGSLEGAMRIGRALAGRATESELSRYLLQVVSSRGIDGTSALSVPGVVDASELIAELCTPVDPAAPGANTAAVLAILRSSRRTVAERPPGAGLEWTLEQASSVLGSLVAAGHAAPSRVAESILRAELAAPEASHPWISIVLDRLGAGAEPVAREMQRYMDGPAAAPGARRRRAPRHRLAAELATTVGETERLVQTLRQWPDGPYGEFAYRLSLPVTLGSPQPVLDAARRADRLRWAPGWPCHRPVNHMGRAIHHIHDEFPGHPIWGDVAIGDLVMALVGSHGKDEARDALRAHALRHRAPHRRYEFLRIWDAAQLGDDGRREADALFGPGDDSLALVVDAIARVPENAFVLDLSIAHEGIGAALLMAVLLEEAPDQEERLPLQAPVWVRSFFSQFPEAIDNLELLADLPENVVADALDGAVPHQGLAGRVQRIARCLSTGTFAIVDAHDARDVGGGVMDEMLRSDRTAGALSTEMLPALLSNGSGAADPILDAMIARLTAGRPSWNATLIRRAFDAEPRGADLTAYVTGLMIADHHTAVVPRALP